MSDTKAFDTIIHDLVIAKHVTGKECDREFCKRIYVL